MHIDDLRIISATFNYSVIFHKYFTFHHILFSFSSSANRSKITKDKLIYIFFVDSLENNLVLYNCFAYFSFKFETLFCGHLNRKEFSVEFLEQKGQTKSNISH